MAGSVPFDLHSQLSEPPSGMGFSKQLASGKLTESAKKREQKMYCLFKKKKKVKQVKAYFSAVKRATRPIA